MEETPDCKRKREEEDGSKCPDAKCAKQDDSAEDSSGDTTEEEQESSESGESKEDEAQWYMGDIGYRNRIEGVFIANLSQVDFARRHNPTVNFGEAAGKHSEVEEEFNNCGVQMITEDPKVIDLFRHLCTIGYNPIGELAEWFDDHEPETCEVCLEGKSGPETPDECA